MVLWINVTDKQDVDEQFCMPVTLLINFCLFQYILTLYWKRRRERRVFMLIMCAFVSFGVLVPFAMPNADDAGHLNDISETCSALTFLMQISLLGNDAQRKRKTRICSLRVMLISAELLELFGIFVIGLNLVKMATSSPFLTSIEFLDNAMEDITLAFIFKFRVYCICLFQGWRKIITSHKLEIVLYLLFMTHEYPFMWLENATEVSWEAAQALWNRLTILMCVLVTIRDRLISSHSSKLGGTTSGFSTANDHHHQHRVVMPVKPRPSRKGPSVTSTSPSTVVSFRAFTQHSVRSMRLKSEKVSPLESTSISP